MARILVTGMSGLIGGIAGRQLAENHEVCALNRRPVPGFETYQASITDPAALGAAFRGVDTVVHMAAYLGRDDAEHMAVNVTGTYNVFEAAREAGVKRVVFGSSGATVEGYEHDEPFLSMVEGRMREIPRPRPVITHLDPVRPVRLYGVAKVWGEALGRSYAESHGMSVLCIRLGRVRPDNRPATPKEAAVYLSHRDAGQMIERCVEAPSDIRFDIYYGVSDNRTRFRDISHAKRVIGYIPEDGIGEWPLPARWAPAA